MADEGFQASGDGDDGDDDGGDGDLSLMWQSAPQRRSRPAVPFPPASPLRVVPVMPVDPPGAVALEDLEAEICSLAASLAASTGGWLRLVAEFDRRKGWAQWGIKSCAHWLAWACSVAPGAAREYVRVASALTVLPLLDAAFAAGRLSYSKVRAATRVADRVPEATLLEQALVHTAAQLERLVRAYRKVDGTGTTQQQRRRARWFFDEDGMLVLTARLPADEGAILLAALEQADDSAESEPDSLMALAHNSLAAGAVDSSGDDRHLLVLHADTAVLTGASDDPEAVCRVEHGPGVDVPTARRIACDAALVALIKSAVPGEQLRLGRKTRKISPALRRALRIRDGGCRFPGCHRIRHLEAHHVVHWLFGGLTDLDNLVLLCRSHHMSVHEDGFTLTPDAPAPDGGGPDSTGWIFRRPDTTEVPTNPGLPAGAPLGEPLPPDLIRPGWRGERFSLADSVSVFCQASDTP